MKKVIVVLAIFFVFCISASAQMNTAQDGGIMGGGWGWGMGYVWGFGIIIVILAVFVVSYMMKRK